eukprot:3890909-Prymnesium_polylepis.1
MQSCGLTLFEPLTWPPAAALPDHAAARSPAPIGATDPSYAGPHRGMHAAAGRAVRRGASQNVRCWHQHPRRGPAPPPARCGCAPRSAEAVVEGKQVSPRPVSWSTHVLCVLNTGAEHWWDKPWMWTSWNTSSSIGFQIWWVQGRARRWRMATCSVVCHLERLLQ